MWLRALELTAPLLQNSQLTFPSLIEGLADKFGDAPALISDSERLTYHSLAARSSQYTAWALRQGLGKGDVVCLIMSNRPEYVAIWLGITRVGAIVSLINTHLDGTALAHALELAAARHIIMGAEYADRIDNIPPLKIPISYWIYGPTDLPLRRIDEDLLQYGEVDLSRLEYQRPRNADIALHIYTSGTTGLPKAAKISHFRLLQWSYWFAGMMDVRPSDRMYNCLPMYHSIGGIVAIGAILVSGGSVLVRQRFSASRFWDDVFEWQCTLFQYIGELCRYLVSGPPHPLETSHQLRLCCGNGLQIEVWHAFRQRFHIPQILEFYAATEGNFSLFNCEEVPGAIGRIPSFLSHRASIALIKCNIDTNEPIRGTDSYCMRCSVNEVGEAIGQIPSNDESLIGRFEGYTDTEDSEKKIIRDVFSIGDAWVRTGDLMRKDEHGYFYFVDRIGDTFRWKGENLSTIEVVTVIAACTGVIDAVVYGVAIDGVEGRAGMAALVTSADFNLDDFRQQLNERLPSYARPIFLRFCRSIEITETFKLKKQSLMRDAYHVPLIDDPIFIDDPESETYIPFGAELYERFRKGQGWL
jgi:fatty-acyl-CoA synthase